MKRSTLANLAGLLGYGIFGFSFLFSKAALDLTTPFILLSIRFIVAFLVLNLLVVLGKAKLELKGKPVRLLLLLGLVQPILYFIFENYGIAMTSASFSGVMLGLTPVVGLVIGRLFLQERCTLLQAGCAVASIVGVGLTSVGGGDGNFSPVGTVLLLGAVVATTLFTTISRGISKWFSPFERTYVMFGLGSVVFTLITLLENRKDMGAILAPMQVPAFWVSVVYLAVVSSVCAFLLINFAMNFVSVGRISIFSNFTTVISVVGGICIMGDSFSRLQLLGIVVIIVSVFLVSMPKKETV